MEDVTTSTVARRQLLGCLLLADVDVWCGWTTPGWAYTLLTCLNVGLVVEEKYGPELTSKGIAYLRTPAPRGLPQSTPCPVCADRDVLLPCVRLGDLYPAQQICWACRLQLREATHVLSPSWHVHHRPMLLEDQLDEDRPGWRREVGMRVGERVDIGRFFAPWVPGLIETRIIARVQTAPGEPVVVSRYVLPPGDVQQRHRTVTGHRLTTLDFVRAALTRARGETPPCADLVEVI